MGFIVKKASESNSTLKESYNRIVEFFSSQEDAEAKKEITDLSNSAISSTIEALQNDQTSAIPIFTFCSGVIPSDDFGYKWYIKTFNTMNADVLYIRPVVLNSKIEEENMSRIKKYAVPDNNVIKDDSGYLGGFIFSPTALLGVSSTHHLRATGIDEKLGYQVHKKRLFAMLMWYHSVQLMKDNILRNDKFELDLEKMINNPGEASEQLSKAMNTWIDSDTAGKAKQRKKQAELETMLCVHILNAASSRQWVQYMLSSEVMVPDNFTNSTQSGFNEQATEALMNLKPQVAAVGSLVTARRREDNTDVMGAEKQSAGDRDIVDRLENKVNGIDMINAKIHGGSSYNRSCSASIRAVSPRGNRREILYNTILPYFTLLAMTVPIHLSNISIGAPLYVQIDIPGKFSSDLAVISSLSRSEINDLGRNNENMALGYNIDISFQDCYDNMGIVDDIGAMYLAPGFMLYLNTLAGIPRTIEVYSASMFLADTMYSFDPDKWIRSLSESIKDFLIEKRNRIDKLTNIIDPGNAGRFKNKNMSLRDAVSSPTAINDRLNVVVSKGFNAINMQAYSRMSE